MSNPIDEESYEDSAPPTRDEVKQGNPGRPQSDFEGLGESDGSTQDPPGDANPDDADEI